MDYFTLQGILMNIEKIVFKRDKYIKLRNKHSKATINYGT